MGEPQYDPRRTPAEHLPPLWMWARDSQGRPIDPRVVQVSEQLWHWAYWHVHQELHDSASAAQLVEGVALRVSSRLRDEPSVSQNLEGYFITAFRHRVSRQVLKENRIKYEGLLRELERNHRLTGPDLEAAMEWKLCLQIIVNLLPEKSRRMLNCRILGFAWNEIGRALSMSEKQAKSRFYYALNKVRATLLDNGAKGAGHPEESN